MIKVTMQKGHCQCLLYISSYQYILKSQRLWWQKVS